MFHKEGFKIISIAGMITVVLILTTDYLFGQSLQTNVLGNSDFILLCDDTSIF